jgi:glutamine kinase
MWPKLRELERLGQMQAQTFKTLPFLAFEVSEWKANPERVLKRIRLASLGPALAVRSCVGMEDAIEREPPGFFDSVLNVPAKDTAVRDAVETVIASYARRLHPSPVSDQIIVQQQLVGARKCGVFRVGAEVTEYIDIDYDETPGQTSTVTSGTASRRVSISPRIAALPSPWKNIRRCADELRGSFVPPFFVEFATDESGYPVVFQIRADRRQRLSAPAAQQAKGLEEAISAIEKCGPLSVMADWNPAEILGVSPLPLDVSLYDELIMKGAWSEGRASIGWARPADPNLMIVVGGRPYVKIRQSLQSLLPAGLEPLAASRLVANRLAYLQAARDLHDKVEFRVMWSAYAIDAAAVRSELSGAGIAFSDIDALFDSLKRVTREAIDTAPALLEADKAGLVQLDAARASLAAFTRGASPGELAKGVREAFRVCVNLGTIPFSRQARLAFTFRYIINHLVECGGLSTTDIARWQAGLNTIVRQFRRDLQQMLCGKMAQAAFLKRYGHLRPSTYDIESLRYDERGPLSADAHEQMDVSAWTPGPCNRLGEILAAVGAETGQSGFWQAAACAYQGREEIKFHFSALLSDVMRKLALHSMDASLGKFELRRVPLQGLLGFLESAASWEAFADSVRGYETDAHWRSGTLRLPDVIWSAGDLDVIMEPLLRPTFVGAGIASGPVRVIEKDTSVRSGDLAGAIVAVETADPGYDWLFGHRVAGLVTAYGGEFSHMGLRCGEFDIPAALGCGPAVFRRVAGAKEFRLDPARGELWADGQRVYPA